MSKRNLFFSLGAYLALAACNLQLPLTQPAPVPVGQDTVEIHDRKPADAPGNTCWSAEIIPAKVGTATEEILVQPAQLLADGTVITPPIYRRETRQTTLEERREIWFRVPCETQLPPDFLASLQRALQARGQFRGAITGVMDDHTRKAIRRYQAPLGLDSSILSLHAARKLGLAVVEHPEDV